MKKCKNQAHTHIWMSNENTLEWCNLIATPDGGLQIWLKFVWFHNCCSLNHAAKVYAFA